MLEGQGEGQQSAKATPSKSSAGIAATPRPEIHCTLATGAHVGLGHGDVKLAAVQRRGARWTRRGARQRSGSCAQHNEHSRTILRIFRCVPANVRV